MVRASTGEEEDQLAEFEERVPRLVGPVLLGTSGYAAERLRRWPEADGAGFAPAS